MPAFLAGFGCGLTTAVALYLLGGLSADPARPGGVTAASAEGDDPAPKVHFEFADVLRESEVSVPFIDAYPDERKQRPSEPGKDVRYLLQAGSFKRTSDAERRRAAILLLGLQVETLEIDRAGESWHRVVVGPFPSRKAVRQAQSKLLAANIDSITLRARDKPSAGDA